MKDKERFEENAAAFAEKIKRAGEKSPFEATFTKIPRATASALRLEATYEARVELANRGEKEKPLIGYSTLEILGFKVNPITGRLEKTEAIEYRPKATKHPF